MTGPRIKPAPKAAPNSPKFWARSSGGNTSAIYALAIPYVEADMPAMKRPRIQLPATFKRLGY